MKTASELRMDKKAGFAQIRSRLQGGTGTFFFIVLGVALNEGHLGQVWIG